MAGRRKGREMEEVGMKEVGIDHRIDERGGMEEVGIKRDRGRDESGEERMEEKGLSKMVEWD